MEPTSSKPQRRSLLRSLSGWFFILGLVLMLLAPFTVWYAVKTFGGGTGVSGLYVVGILLTFTGWIPFLASFITAFVHFRRTGIHVPWQMISLILFLLWLIIDIVAAFRMQ